MNSSPDAELPPVASATASAGEIEAPAAPGMPRWLLTVLALLAALAMLSSLLLWQKLSVIQEQLARQSADAGTQSQEARATAKQAQDVARDAAARVAVFDARLSEVALQRTQLEELMQSL